MVSAVTDMISSTISMALAVMGIIGRWFIFQHCGKDGWRAIVPFLNTYTYGEIVNEKKKTIAWIVLSIVLIIFAFTLGISLGLLIGLTEEGVDVPDIGYALLMVVFIASLLIVFIIEIIILILRISIFKKVNEKLEVNSNWIFGWIFIPNITEMILGLSLKNSSN